MFRWVDVEVMIGYLTYPQLGQIGQLALWSDPHEHRQKGPWAQIKLKLNYSQLEQTSQLVREEEGVKTRRNLTYSQPV